MGVARWPPVRRILKGSVLSIKHIEVAEVGCERCDKTIVVHKWTDARNHGWAVPCDGHLQLCPACVQFEKGVLSATAVNASGNTAIPPAAL